MRLLLIGSMNGQIGAASKIALQKGGSVTLAETVDQALDMLRGGTNADFDYGGCQAGYLLAD